MRTRIILLALLFCCLPRLSEAQTEAPCGVVDTIGYPIDSIVEGYDDFALYRSRFGGNHTGLDIGFDQWGDPVYAAAKGLVTLSDPEEWDTEKGVVIIEHTFPDGSVAYSLYGHMEQTDTLSFPQEGVCVDRGQILGAIGWPSRGKPHLHYEMRRFLPNDGGPGYVENNPLESGWYHPLDFTNLWSVRLTPGFIRHTTFDIVPFLPPVQLDSGTYIIASGDVIAGVDPPGDLVWRIRTDGIVTGLEKLPGDLVAVHTRNGQVSVLQGGRFAAVWQLQSADEPPVVLGANLVFVTGDGSLTARNVIGDEIWQVPFSVPDVRVTAFDGNGQEVLVGLHDDTGDLLRVVDFNGNLTFEQRISAAPTVAPTLNGGWLVLEGTDLSRVQAGTRTPIGTVSPPPGRTATLTGDMFGNSYVYLGDADDTLLAFNADGTMRWRTQYPSPAGTLPPLMHTGNGCVLYTLDAEGTFNLFDAATGTLINQMQLYAGGRRSSQPRARLLDVNGAEQVRVAAGFLTTVLLDGWQLAPDVMQNCRMG